jgi:hypothetical protein
MENGEGVIGNKGDQWGGNKKWQAYHIAPLQPPTLAVFRPWGSSVGAGRMRPAGAKLDEFAQTQKLFAERKSDY